MLWPVRELGPSDRRLLTTHFVALRSDDRRLRFGVPVNDFAIGRYVERIDFGHDGVFGVFDDSLALVGAAHLARASGHAELGVSVLPEARNRGVGAALLSRAMVHARNWGLSALLVHCLRENRAMMHLARKLGMAITAEAGEADAWLRLPRPDAGTFFGEAFEQQVGLLDFALKAQLAGTRRALDALRSRHGEVEQAVAAPARH
ncbi:MAG TPA: GNAT family N-acetyltransferase [Burkholderiales bacterium]|nr:GNAT family N-acetyltransferase [Burkholderiales bacterium]